MGTKTPLRHAEQQYRNSLRKVLFNKTPERKTDDWLMSQWSMYVNLNFELAKPGPYLAVAELKQMVTDCQTPAYVYHYHKHTHNPIPSRKLGDLELAKLRGLLLIYEAKLQAKDATLKDTKLQIKSLQEKMSSKARCSTKNRNKSYTQIKQNNPLIDSATHKKRQCSAITRRKTQCTCTARHGYEFCLRHQTRHHYETEKNNVNFDNSSRYYHCPFF